MTIGRAGFQYHPTTTPGKLNIIKWQESAVHQVYNKTKFTGKGVSIPGHHSQLARHRDELLSYGIAEENQIMVDWTFDLYMDLRREAQRIGFKGKVFWADLITVVKSLWKNGEQVDVIDFDDIGHLSQKHVDLLKEACKHNVKVFIGVFATRGARGGLNNFQQYWKNFFNMKPYRHWRGNMTYKLRDLQGMVVGHVARSQNYRSQYKEYKGRSTMVSCVVTK